MLPVARGSKHNHVAGGVPNEGARRSRAEKIVSRFQAPHHPLTFRVIYEIDREASQPLRSNRRRWCSRAVPAIGTNVVVVPPRTQKRSFPAKPLHQTKTESIDVEVLCVSRIVDHQVHVPDPSCRGHAGPRRLRSVLAQGPHVQGCRPHLQLAADHGPSLRRPVAVEFEAVALGVCEVERLADEMIGGALQRVSQLPQMSVGIRKGLSVRYLVPDAVREAVLESGVYAAPPAEYARECE